MSRLCDDEMYGALVRSWCPRSCGGCNATQEELAVFAFRGGGGAAARDEWRPDAWPDSSLSCAWPAVPPRLPQHACCSRSCCPLTSSSSAFCGRGLLAPCLRALRALSERHSCAQGLRKAKQSGGVQTPWIGPRAPPHPELIAHCSKCPYLRRIVRGGAATGVDALAVCRMVALCCCGKRHLPHLQQVPWASSMPGSIQPGLDERRAKQIARLAWGSLPAPARWW